ncbi:MAG: NUDIX hydrolase [Bacteroidetes bacterium]|nr:NUDIX hydrolase [Bacteroidota bacterium]
MNETENPWKIVSQKNIYDNPWIHVTEYDVINPTGGKGIYGKVHFKNIAVGIIPLDDEMNIWIVGQYRFTINQYSWEIPEGGGIVGTDPLEAAKRELREETGLVAAKWTETMRLYLSNSVSDELCIVFLAQQLQLKNAMPEETEKILVKKIPFSEAYQMVQEGIITDAISVAAIQKIRLMINEGLL